MRTRHSAHCVEAIKGATIERYFEDGLREREHAATAKEMADIAILAASARILIARINAGGHATRTSSH